MALDRGLVSLTKDEKDEKAKKRQEARRNRINGFETACNEVIHVAAKGKKLDQPGVSGTEETHIGGYSEAMTRIYDAVEKIKKAGITDDKNDGGNSDEKINPHMFWTGPLA